MVITTTEHYSREVAGCCQPLPALVSIQWELLRSASPPSSEVTVSASATSEGSGSACKTPKVLPVSSMNRRSSPSACTERPLLGTTHASASPDITSRTLRIVTDPSTFWICEEAVIALKYRLLQSKFLRVILS